MKTLDQIKQEYANEGDYKDWDCFMSDLPIYQRKVHYDNVAKIYATQAIKADRERVAENVRLVESVRHSAIYDTIDKESIINLSIELP